MENQKLVTPIGTFSVVFNTDQEYPEIAIVQINEDGTIKDYVAAVEYNTENNSIATYSYRENDEEEQDFENKTVYKIEGSEKQWYRCPNCDFCGTEVTFDEYKEDYACPDCGEVCDEYEPMTKEEEKFVEEFFDNDSLLLPENGRIEDGTWAFIFDDYAKVDKIMKDNPSYSLYTVVECDGDQTWIYSGGRLVNRIGYVISTNEIKINGDCFRVY